VGRSKPLKEEIARDSSKSNKEFTTRTDVRLWFLRLIKLSYKNWCTSVVPASGKLPYKDWCTSVVPASNKTAVMQAITTEPE
jgi:hypothetical protein